MADVSPVMNSFVTSGNRIDLFHDGRTGRERESPEQRQQKPPFRVRNAGRDCILSWPIE